MRNIYIIASTFFILIQVNIVYSHGQDVHQHIVREAWKLVEYQVPELIGSDIANWIGEDQTDYCLCVVSGAYNEDQQDIIYRNCGWNFLSGCVMTSVNHFWDADAGDYSTFNWNGNHANALVKANHMYYGTHLWDFATPSDPDHFVWEVDHNGLSDLYLTGNYIEHGYYNNNGQHYNINPPEQSTFTMVWRKRTSYDILGRICHLLGDMSVPAHAHNDAHSPLSQGGVDTYEQWCKSYLNPFGGAFAYTFEDALQQGGILFDVLNKYYPIRYLMYVTNQCADFFPSDGDWGGMFFGDRNYSNSYSYNGQLDEYPILDQIFSELGNPPINIDVENQANLLMPLVIRTTASLLLIFAVETNQWNPNLSIAVINDFGHGEIMFDDIIRNSPYYTTVYYGTTHSFGAIDQNYQEPGQPIYYREFNEWSLPGDRKNTNRTFREAVFRSGNYIVRTLRHFDYFATNNFINGSMSPGILKINDQQINLPCSSYVREENQIKTEAPPQQQTVNGRLINYNFQAWDTGPFIYSNPRTFIPNDHFTVQAIYKGHRVSNSATAISSNSQRKIIFDGTKYHLVYEDQGEIYYTNSDDGVNWVPEVRVSNGSGLNKGACIASDYSSTIAVAWQEANQILVRTRSFAGQWGQIKAVDPPLGSDSYDATPVIDYGYDFYYYIVWRHYELLS